MTAYRIGGCDMKVLMAMLLGDEERAVVKRVADELCEGNKSQAVRRIIREYAKDRDLPIPGEIASK